MRSRGLSSFWRTIIIIIAGLLIVGGGVYLALTNRLQSPLTEFLQPAPTSPAPIALATPTQQPTATPTPTASATATIAVTVETTTEAEAALSSTGIVYVLSPDINSVGWIESGEQGNHFGESHLYTGVREGKIYHGAMQFDLSFIQDESTIFSAELELTGLAGEGLTDDSSFELNILAAEIDERWSRHGFSAIQNAEVEETLSPPLEAKDLGPGRVNKFVFNAAQRSIIEDRLESNFLSLRLDSLFPEGWFSWDSGYGEETVGQGPILRLGVSAPPETEVAAEPPPGSTPTPTPTFIIITSTPTPENVMTAAAIAPRLTAEAATTGTPTPLPQNWVTPLVVTATPTPENTGTAIYQAVEATAAVLIMGTSTPTPQNLFTATPTPTETATPIYILLEGELPPVTPTPTVSVTPLPTPTIPAQLMGMIAFKSDRSGQEEIYVINPDGTGLALLTNRWPYLVAEMAERYSADGRFHVFTKDAVRYENVTYADNSKDGVGVRGERNDVPAVFWYDSLYGVEEQLTNFGLGYAYQGVWSPTREQIAFLSNDSGDDEIWVANKDGSDMRRLTETNEAYNAREIGKDTFIPEVNGHPTWSPDGNYLAFWSNRTGRGQIWVMDTQGNNLYTLSRTSYNDWDPVWIKYPGVPANAHLMHSPYHGSFPLMGPTRDCKEFSSPGEAQAFYWAVGGPARDPHKLDPDLDGIACN